MSRHQQFPSLPRPAQEYLDGLSGELRDLPRARRREIVADIAAHIAGELDTAGASAAEEHSGDGMTAAGRSPDTVHGILDRLGPPAEIARSARSELPTTPARMAGRDITTVVLLLVGGFALLVGWLVGLALLWTSTAWKLRDKIIGTVLVPGGLAAPFLLAETPQHMIESGCFTRSAATGAGCATPSQWLPVAVGIALLIVTIAGPIFTTIWLATHAQRTALVQPPGAAVPQYAVTDTGGRPRRGIRPRRGFRPSPATVTLLALGVCLVVVYSVLDSLNVGKIGSPTDIGGGLILLVGLILAAIGVAKGIFEFARRRDTPRPHP